MKEIELYQKIQEIFQKINPEIDVGLELFDNTYFFKIYYNYGYEYDMSFLVIENEIRLDENFAIDYNVIKINGTATLQTFEEALKNYKEIQKIIKEIISSNK